MLRTTLRSLWAHKRRLLSTTVAVLLGVAFMTGTMVLGDTMDNSFNELFAEINEGVDAEVRGPELIDTGFGMVREPLSEDLVDVVARVDGVEAAAGYLSTAGGRILDSEGEAIGPAQGPPTLLGSWIDDPELAGIQLVDGRGPESLDEVALNVGAADDGGLSVGDPIEVVSGEGRETFTLVGTYQIGGQDTAAGSITADFLPEVAQRLAGQPGQFQTIVARAEGDLSQEELVERIQAALPAGPEVVTGEQAGDEVAESISQGLSFFTTFLLVFAFIALVVGSFIIYNTFSILVAQRGRELALLRALGASRRQVLGSVLLEAALVGLVASIVGLLLGIALAIGLQSALGALGLDLPTSATTITPTTIILALVVGLAITFASAVVPARRATRVPPIAALRDVAEDRSGTSKVRAGIGAVVLVAALAALAPAFGDDPDTAALQSVGLGALLLLIAIIVLGPVIARPLAKLLGSFLPRLRGMPGTLARENAARSPKRTASTAAALMIGVALVGFITVFATSARASVDAELGRGFTGDFVIATDAFDLGIPGALRGEILQLDEVETVASLRQGLAQVTLPGGDVRSSFLGAVDPDQYLDVIDVRMESGSLSELRPGAIVLDRQVVEEEEIAIGDQVDVTFTTGSSATFTVAAVSDDPFLLGTYTLNLEDWTTHVANPADGMLFIKAAEGVDLVALDAELTRLADAYPTVQVQDEEDFLGSVASQLNQLLNVVYGLLALSVLIALIGIANTLSLSIHERTRELGLLRAVGMTRRQLRSTVRWEAAIIALIGTALGLVVGVGLSYALVQALQGQGFSQYEVPVPSLVVIVVVFAALGVLASVLPARRAARLDVLEAIAAD